MTRRFRLLVAQADALRTYLQHVIGKGQGRAHLLREVLGSLAVPNDDGIAGAVQILTVAMACAHAEGVPLSTVAQPHHSYLRGLLAALADDEDHAAEIARMHAVVAQEDLPLRDLLWLHEALLQAQVPALRRRVGAFHTPPPVARFIIEQVHGALQAAGIAFGLLDDRSYRQLGLTPPPQVDADSPAIVVLEPSVGSGVFLTTLLHYVVDIEGESLDAGRMARLLRRVRAIELLPASSEVCRLLVRASLVELGYRGELAELIQLETGDFLAAATDGAAWLSGCSVVIGNPPYARASQHRSQAMRDWLATYRTGLSSERNLQPLSDDYIKFMRAAEVITQRAPVAALGLVTNHTYLRGKLHRAMRASLRSSFPSIAVTDLHGNSKVRGRGPRDENVFGIAQGVAVAVMTRGGQAQAPCGVTFSELRGRRRDKLDRLSQPSSLSIRQLPGMADLMAPTEPLPREYSDFVPLSELFEFYSVGGKPGDDGVLVGFERDQLLSQLRSARDRMDSEQPGTTEAARRLSQRPAERPFDASEVITYAYRPFDERVAYYEPEIWTRPLRALYEHVDGRPILLTTRIVKDESFAHVFATRRFPDVIALSTTSSVNCYAFPLATMRPERLSEATGMTLSPEEAFAYVYGALHSGAYRSRYLGGLRTDFPRVPVMSDPALIASLVARGGRLLALHLGETKPRVPRPRFVDGGDRRILRGLPEDAGELLESDGGARVGVNDHSYFTSLPKEAWSFRVGGYQVCRKWLLDRRRAGRPLSDDDIFAYCDIVARIAETHSLQVDIDALIERFGGFPNAVRRLPGRR